MVVVPPRTTWLGQADGCPRAGDAHRLSALSQPSRCRSPRVGLRVREPTVRRLAGAALVVRLPPGGADRRLADLHLRTGADGSPRVSRRPPNPPSDPRAARSSSYPFAAPRPSWSGACRSLRAPPSASCAPWSDTGSSGIPEPSSFRPCVRTSSWIPALSHPRKPRSGSAPVWRLPDHVDTGTPA